MLCPGTVLRKSVLFVIDLQNAQFVGGLMSFLKGDFPHANGFAFFNINPRAKEYFHIIYVCVNFVVVVVVIIIIIIIIIIMTSEGLDVWPFPYPSRCSWSYHLFL